MEIVEYLVCIVKHNGIPGVENNHMYLVILEMYVEDSVKSDEKRRQVFSVSFCALEIIFMRAWCIKMHINA